MILDHTRFNCPCCDRATCAPNAETAHRNGRLSDQEAQPMFDKVALSLCITGTPVSSEDVYNAPQD
jgi:hypothetical protein